MPNCWLSFWNAQLPILLGGCWHIFWPTRSWVLCSADFILRERSSLNMSMVETRAVNANLSWLQPVTSLQHPMHNCTDYSQGVESPTTQESHHWCECASLLISSTNSTGKRSKWPKQKTPCTIWSFLLLANKLAKQLLFTFCKSKWQEYGNEILEHE